MPQLGTYPGMLDDPIPDRAALAAAAREKQTTKWWITAACSAGLTVLLAVPPLLGSRPLVALLIATAFGVALAVALFFAHPSRHRGGYALMTGADLATRRAVGAALRTRRPADRRIDALARDAAERGLPNAVRLLVAVAVLGTALVTIELTAEHRRVDFPIMTVITVLLVVMLLAMIVRYRRYLRR